MKRKRHSEEEIIKKLREAQTMQAGGASIEEAGRKLEISAPTYHRWKQEYGGAKVETVKRLKELERENGRNQKARGGAGIGHGDSQRGGGGNVVSPERKREAVGHVCRKVKNVSERRACKVVRQARSTQRYRARKPGKDAANRAELRRIAVVNSRPGYRMARALLPRTGLELNAKKVHRLWREEGLRVSRRTRKRARQGSGENSAQRKAAEGINHVWSYDFIFDQTADGRRLKWLLICGEFSRKLVAVKVERKLKAQDVIRVLEKAVQERGAPEFIRSDNGPEFVATAVKDWIEKSGFATLYIEPGAPWQNAYIESLNSRFRDELLNVELCASHAKPWADCAADDERLNVFNGFLLGAHLDALFDRGLGTFDENGTGHFSAHLDSATRSKLGLENTIQLRWNNPQHGTFLAWHRQNVFRC